MLRLCLQARRREWFWVAGLVALAAMLRLFFLSGFALGDDLGYVAHAKTILSGEYPILSYQNQYAYRPLLLYLMAAGMALFGFNDFGLVSPFYFFSLASCVLVYLLGKLLADRKTALLALILFVFYPFNLTGATTVHNDLLLGFWIHLAFAFLLLSNRYLEARKGLLFAALAGLALFSAYLTKVTALFALFMLGLHSLWTTQRLKKFPLPHAILYLSYGLGIAAACLVYHLKTGDFFWHFKAERNYYLPQLARLSPNIIWENASYYWWYYLRHLFGWHGSWRYGYNEHGWFHWLVVFVLPILIWKGGVRKVMFPLGWIGLLLFCLHFFPHQILPFYVPIVRQSRYLELSSISLVLVLAQGIASFRMRRVYEIALLLGIIINCLFHAQRRYEELNDSCRDAEEIARFLKNKPLEGKKTLFVDQALGDAMSFYALEHPHNQRIRYLFSNQSLGTLSHCYVALGGARPFWWSPDVSLEFPGDMLPSHWREIKRLEKPLRPWRRSSLRIYSLGSSMR